MKLSLSCRVISAIRNCACEESLKTFNECDTELTFKVLSYTRYSRWSHVSCRIG